MLAFDILMGFIFRWLKFNSHERRLSEILRDNIMKVIMEKRRFVKVCLAPYSYLFENIFSIILCASPVSFFYVNFFMNLIIFFRGNLIFYLYFWYFFYGALGWRHRLKQIAFVMDSFNGIYIDVASHLTYSTIANRLKT